MYITTFNKTYVIFQWFHSGLKSGGGACVYKFIWGQKKRLMYMCNFRARQKGDCASAPPEIIPSLAPLLIVTVFIFFLPLSAR